MTVENVLYRTSVESTGGRDGSSKAADGSLELKLSTPRELGGAGGDGTNPEQLFAAGYSACFIGAMKFVAARDKLPISKTPSVKATVGIGPIATGFGIEVDLEVSLPGIERDAAQELVNRAHVVCPYSNATKGNIDVRLSVV